MGLDSELKKEMIDHSRKKGYKVSEIMHLMAKYEDRLRPLAATMIDILSDPILIEYLRSDSGFRKPRGYLEEAEEHKLDVYNYGNNTFLRIVPEKRQYGGHCFELHRLHVTLENLYRSAIDTISLEELKAGVNSDTLSLIADIKLSRASEYNSKHLTSDILEDMVNRAISLEMTIPYFTKNPDILKPEFRIPTLCILPKQA